MNYYAKVVLEGKCSTEILKLIELLHKEVKDTNEDIKAYTILQHNSITNDYTILEVDDDLSDRIICAGKDDVFEIVYNGKSSPSQKFLKRIKISPATIDFLVGGSR